MSSHSWLVIVTVVLCATVIFAGGKPSSLTDDPILNKILSNEEKKPLVKWSPNTNIGDNIKYGKCNLLFPFQIKYFIETQRFSFQDIIKCCRRNISI